MARPNLSVSTSCYLSSLGLEVSQSTTRFVWDHALATTYSPAYLAENAAGIRQGWPRIPLPNTADLLRASAALGEQVAALVDPDTPVPGVSTGAIRPELASIAVPTTVPGVQRDWRITGWGSRSDKGITAEMTVRDFGIGLPKDQPDKIFDHFFSTKQQGMGMGLQIVRSIVEGHGGLGEALFAAGAGLAGLRRIDQQLARQLEQLYKPRGQNKEISIHFRAIQETRDQLRFRTLQVEAWLGQEEKQRQAIARKTMLEAERSGSTRKLRMSRLRTRPGSAPSRRERTRAGCRSSTWRRFRWPT